MLSVGTSSSSLLNRMVHDFRAGLAGDAADGAPAPPAWRWIADNFLVKDANTGKATPLIVFPWMARVLLDVFPDDQQHIPYSLLVYSTVKKSGKTAVNGAIAAYLVFRRAPPGSEMYVFANSEEQSVGRVFAALKYAVEKNPALRRLCTATLPETSIRLRNGSSVKAMAAMHANIAGANPYYSAWTELWGYVHPLERRAWEEMTPPPTVRNSIRVVDTYAGYEGESSLLNDIEDRLKAGERLYVDGYTLPSGYLDYADDVMARAPELRPYMMPDAKRRDALVYNTPLPCYVDHDGRAYGLWDEGAAARRMPWQHDVLGERYYREQETNLLPGSFQRLHLNRRAKRGGQYVPLAMWKMLEQCEAWKEGDHRPVVLAIDAATHNDHMAMVGARQAGGVPEECYAREWTPQPDPRAGGKAVIVPSDALVELRRLRNAGMRIVAVAYDPYQFHDVALRAAAEGFKMVEFPQQARRALADTYLRQIIVNGGLRHTHDPALEAAVENADAIEERGRTGDEKRIRIVKGAGKVDPLVALSMAVWTATQGAEGGTNKSKVDPPMPLGAALMGGVGTAPPRGSRPRRIQGGGQAAKRYTKAR